MFSFNVQRDKKKPYTYKHTLVEVIPKLNLLLIADKSALQHP